MAAVAAIAGDFTELELRLKPVRIVMGVFLPLVLGPVSDAFAESWTCRNAGLTRHVLTFYPQAPSSLPCKVFYSKPNEHVMPRTLWKSEHTEHFCESKAESFVERLESWGWQCRVDREGSFEPKTPPHR